VAVPGLNAAPPALLICDANHDGRADVLAFNSYASPVLLLGQAQGPLLLAAGGAGPLVNAGRPAVTVLKPGKNQEEAGLLVSQNNYARRVRLDETARWIVQDQLNSGQSSARVEGAAMIDVQGDGTLEAALYDRATGALLWLAKEDGVFRPKGSLKLGSIDFQGLETADFDGDGRDDLLVAGTDRFAVVLTGRSGPRLQGIAEYTSRRRDSHLGDLMASDLNGDDKPDLLLIDNGKHFMEILAVQPNNPFALRPALEFPIFEAKSFRARDLLVEPREMAVGDFDGDGLKDFALVVHDRVLLYRQDRGPAGPAVGTGGER
jgi:hypothetical protein